MGDRLNGFTALDGLISLLEERGIPYHANGDPTAQPAVTFRCGEEEYVAFDEGGTKLFFDNDDGVSENSRSFWVEVCDPDQWLQLVARLDAGGP